MVPGSGSQYIDAMLSALWPRVSGLPSFNLLQALPSQCLLCHSWQSGTLCQACSRQWRHPRLRCQRCAIDLPRGHCEGICTQCEDQSPEFDRAITALDYTAPWSPLMARLKFHGATELARPLGRLLADAVAPRRGRVNLVLPVPLSPKRFIERGYNQSWLIARQVAKRLDLPVRHDVLSKVRHTSRMMSLSAEERRLHIHGAFELTRQGAKAIQGKDVAVVDDVMTTGATLNEIAHVLREGGARSVSVWVVARTPAPPTANAPSDLAEAA
jgi:ComF family protein